MESSELCARPLDRIQQAVGCLTYMYMPSRLRKPAGGNRMQIRLLSINLRLTFKWSVNMYEIKDYSTVLSCHLCHLSYGGQCSPFDMV